MLESVGKPRLETFSLRITPPAEVQLIGVIAIPDPAQVLGVFFAHSAVTNDGLGELVVDVRRLAFVNSSAIRLFVD
ncbi:MAG: hypothetical protein ABUL62_21820 [Myxococcales bacterium]